MHLIVACVVSFFNQNVVREDSHIFYHKDVIVTMQMDAYRNSLKNVRMLMLFGGQI